jgi:CBS domain-containing protein/anti-sigma regulatory factor (Ser/Thr protein kinase)
MENIQGDSAQRNDIPISTDDSPSVVLELIYQLKIRDVMTGAVISCDPSKTLRHIQNIMRESRVTGIPIVENQKLVGMVSIDDIISALDKGQIDLKAGETMTREVVVLQDDMPLSFAISYLNKYHYGRFPVLNKEQELVGIISPIDVVRSLLVEMNREILRLEKIQKEGSSMPSVFSEMEFNVARYDFEIAGHASTEIKKALKGRQIDPKIIRRIAIASYELEINIVAHSNGGTLQCSIFPDKVCIVATDTGPGIADVNLALQEGWSTATEYVRSLGFGAGMGLANTKRVSDEFSIQSVVGTGTTVRSVVYIDSSKDE